MGRPSTLSMSQPHSHSNGSIRTIGTTSIRKPERTRTGPSSQHDAPPIATNTFPIPTRHSSTTHPYYTSQFYEPTPSYPQPSHNRPSPISRHNSVQTRYMTMLLSLDTIPRLHNIYAAFFTWILLAGFIIFPGTFTSIQHLDNDPFLTSSSTATFILHSFKHVSLLVIAGICCFIGSLGMLWLWYVWAANYVWLLNRIFLPGCLNSAAGLIGTLINVYSQQGGAWSVSARATGVVSGTAMVVLGGLCAVYQFWLLRGVRRRHEREVRGEVRGGESLLEKVGRKAREPGLEPGSVV